MNCRKEKNIISTLFERSNGTKQMIMSDLPDKATKRIDEVYQNMTKIIALLKSALQSQSWRQIEFAVEGIILKLLDNHNPDALFAITPSKRLEREFFVQFGGMHLLIQLLEPPLSLPDARQIPASQIQRHVELWNEVLVILREVCFAVPALADTLFSDKHLAFLFSLTAHEYVFENAMNLLEEVLAVRQETFCLSLVSDFYGLVGSFSTRRLAHFCRVLALLIFEPEDRVIMINANVLRSLELLSLRKDRMSKRSSGDIDRNQSIVIGMPGLMGRLISLLRIANHGPTVSELLRHDFQMPSTLSAEFFMYMSQNRQQSEWEHFESLERTVRAGSSPNPPTASPPPTGPVPPPASSPPSSSSFSSSSLRDATTALSQSLSTASATASTLRHATTSALTTAATSLMSGDITDSAYFGLDELELGSDDEQDMEEMTDVIGLHGGAEARIAAALRQVRSQNQQLQSVRELTAQVQESLVNMLQALQPSLQMQMFPPPAPPPSSSASSPPTQAVVEAARSELTFLALSLAPHQVELLFVMCTLLAGRMKIDAQRQFAELGLGDVLLRMFPRMSWEAPPHGGPNPLEHIHGPDCECNSESALRLQFLRLVHNFVDRDFHNNPLSDLFLTEQERLEVLRGAEDGVEEGEEEKVDDWSFLEDDTTGLLLKITRVLIRDPHDSMYRFWLSSCVESFLRSTGPAEQRFLVRKTGLLGHLLDHITGVDLKAAGAGAAVGQGTGLSVSHLQTSFDLLGELVKNNPRAVELVEARLLRGDGSAMERFLGVLQGRLVDSNVFLRSLVLTVEAHGRGSEATGGVLGGGAGAGHYYLPPSCLHPLGSSGVGGYSLLAAGLNQDPHLGEKQQDQQEKLPSSGAAVPVAAVSYLTHSWLQYAPPVLSPEALRLTSLHESRALQPPSSGKKKVTTPRPPAAGSGLNRGVPAPAQLVPHARAGEGEGAGADRASFSSLSTSMRDYFNSIRDLTNNFMRFSHLQAEAEVGPDAGPEGAGGGGGIGGGCDGFREQRGARSVSSNISLYDFKDAIEEYEYVMRSEPLLRSGNVSSSTTGEDQVVEGSCTDDGSLLEKTVGVEAGGRVEEDEDEDEDEEVDRARRQERYDSALVLSPGSRHICCFLHAQRPLLVLRLMCAVNLRSVNHENICCINSALLVFIFAHRIGCLGNLLHGLRHLVLSGEQEDELDLSVRRWRPEIALTLPVRRGDAMRNFRELLWFWGEYYLRRGRDRLSLEFSSHVRFPEWFSVVELLSADDGSETALLKSAVSLPQTPYVYPNNNGNSASFSFVQYF